MRIEVVRTGGFAAIERHGALETTGRADGPRLEALAREVVSASPPGPVRGVPDGFTYSVTAEGRSADFADPHLTSAQRELVRAVLGEGA